MIRNALALFIFAIALAVTPRLAGAQASYSIVQDLSFDEGEWSITTPSRPSFSASGVQTSIGGFSGFWRRNIRSLPAETEPVRTFHIYEAESYDPASEGAISSVFYSDRVLPISGQVQHRAVLRQGGEYFLGTGYVVGEGLGQE